MGALGSALKFIGGIGVGLGVGAAVAVILAPQSGEETKRLLQERWNTALAVGKEMAKEKEKELHAAYEATLTATSTSKVNKQLKEVDAEIAEARKQLKKVNTQLKENNVVETKVEK